MNKLDEMKDKNGNLPAFVWPGGYPIYYLDREGSTLCAACATKSLNDPDEISNFKPWGHGIHYEGQTIQCDNCNAEIESAYGDPEENS